MRKQEIPRPRIGPGYRVGKLAVVSPTGEKKNGYHIWLCSCECGGSIQLDTRCLQRGTIRDCGCETRLAPGQRDITGERFGMLTALYPTGERGQTGCLIWRCKCDCGGEVDAPLSQLTQGYRKSCGCLEHPPLKGFIGKRFHRLTVTGYAGKRYGKHFWKCRCDCGKEREVGQTQLQSGRTRSCGCIREESLKLIAGTSVVALERTPTRLLVSNRSGYNGVWRNSRNGRWAASIGFRQKTVRLGEYARIEEAVRARAEAEEKLYGGFLSWYYRTHPEETEGRGQGQDDAAPVPAGGTGRGNQRKGDE